MSQAHGRRKAAGKDILIELLRQMSDDDLDCVEEIVRQRALKSNHDASSGFEEVPQEHAVPDREAE